jgi:cation diffusion facilitator family transporter
MPEPQAHPHAGKARRVALHTIIASLVLMVLKFTVFRLTNSAAVFSDAMESIINLVAAAMLMYTLWLSNHPADKQHPYGHGKVEFMAIGLEGWLILIAGLTIAYEAIRRLFGTNDLHVEPWHLYMLGGVSGLVLILGIYVWWAGRKYQNAPLAAHGKHLMTDLASSVAVLGGLVIVQWTQTKWLDPLFALVIAAAILFTSWKLLWQSIDGLMDRIDPKDDEAIARLLDEEVASGVIRGYHKVRHRHSGAFHWVDMHLQMDPHMTVAQSHEQASRIEHRIEVMLGQANATAHVEPWRDLNAAVAPTQPLSPAPGSCQAAREAPASPATPASPVLPATPTSPDAPPPSRQSESPAPPEPIELEPPPDRPAT